MMTSSAAHMSGIAAVQQNSNRSPSSTLDLIGSDSGSKRTIAEPREREGGFILGRERNVWNFLVGLQVCERGKLI